MTPEETIVFVDAMRSRGATRVRVGEVEVVFEAAPAPARAAPAWPAHQSQIVDTADEEEIRRALRDRDELWSAPGSIAGLRSKPA